MSSVSISPSASPVRAGDTRVAIARHGPIDVLRMAAVIPIVFYHAGVLNQTIALIGMHALIVAAVVFAAGGRSKGTALQVVTKRASRLVWPWLFFGLIHLAAAIHSHNTKPWMFLIGGSMHLWFVPFIFVVTCGVALASRAGELKRGWLAVIAWSFLAMGLILVEAIYTPVLVDHVPVWQFLDGSTAVLIGLVAYCVPERAGRFGSLTVAAILTLMSLPLWIPFRTPDMMWIAPAGAGAMLFFAVKLLPANSNNITDFLGRASFGLYLMHPLVEHYILILAGHRLHTAPEQLSTLAVVVCSVITIITCLTIIAVLERTPAKRIVL